MTDANAITNFNFGFSTHKSDVLIHLSQWQYWWWFWFSLFWVMYFFIILRVINKRTFQFNPVINTSIRGHGKWGDFLVALIPLSWCGNILVNSNFILRMIEWQNEGSLFSLRIIGRQWYWEYRYDSSAVASILSAPKNIGHNKWFFTYTNESYCSDTYYQALTLGMQLEAKFKFYKDLKKVYDFTGSKVAAGSQKGASIYTRPETPNCLSIIVHPTMWNLDCKLRSWHRDLLRTRGINNRISFYNDMNLFLTFFTLTYPRDTSRMTDYLSITVHRVLWNIDHTFSEFFKSLKDTSGIKKIVSRYHNPKPFNTFYNLTFLDERTNYASNVLVSCKRKPISILSGVLNKHNIDILKNSPDTFNKPILFVLKFWNKSGKLETKPETSHLFWGFRQKKYVRKSTFKFKPRKVYSPDFLKTALVDDNTSKIHSPFTLKSNLSVDSHGGSFGSNFLKFPSITKAHNGVANLSWDGKTDAFVSLLDNAWNTHRSLKFNRHRGELVPVNLARRLLRTKRILVLPAHVNITLITNSGDVVHSWFIPGLGIKIDCVPGRSTHHSFYIDNVGCYYGQCAEICGRYHHHMPIRLCALPFEQFLVWWQHKGLKRFHRLKSSSTSLQHNVNDIKFRYKW